MPLQNLSPLLFLVIGSAPHLLAEEPSHVELYRSLSTHRVSPGCGTSVAGASVPLFAWVISLPPVAQPISYHNFADQRWLYGVPNFWNVASNLPFAVVGALGCWWLLLMGAPS